jgi:DHA1 family multidrug resistance protein-like MFS transporter
MADLVREAPLGMIVRRFTGSKVLKFPEEKDGFHLPDTWKLVADAVEPSTGALELKGPVGREEVSAVLPEPDAVHEKKHHHHLHLEGAVTRVISRFHTRPWTEERFNIEKGEELESATHQAIMPQKTNEGHILVDWYTTTDPDNPQNWSPKKKNWILFILLLVLCDTLRC